MLESNRLLRIAAEKGVDSAQSLLGMNLLKGVGCMADEKAAIKMLMSAAKAGNAKALNNLGVCYKNGIAVEKNLPLAVEYFRRSADSGYPVACANLAICYLDGISGNYRLAVEYLKKAALTFIRIQGNALRL